MTLRKDHIISLGYAEEERLVKVLKKKALDDKKITIVGIFRAGLDLYEKRLGIGAALDK